MQLGKGHPPTTMKSNTDNSNILYPISGGRRFIAHPINNDNSHQNQDALQQLEQNLRSVLKQQHLPQKIQQHYQAQGMNFVPLSQNGHRENTVRSDRNEKTFGNSSTPRTMEERSSNHEQNDNGSDKCIAVNRQRRNIATPTSHLSPLSSPSFNRNNNGLYALGDEVQPLSTTDLQKDFRSHVSSRLSSDAILGNWSELINSEETSNDILMNNLFHSELKMSRENKTTDNVNKLKSPTTFTSNSSQRHVHPFSKVESTEPLPPTSKHAITPKEMNIEKPSQQNPATGIVRQAKDFQDLQSNHSNVMLETLPDKRSKDQTKIPRRKNPKDASSLSKSKQKRKRTLKRKPKFPALQKDPPLEEQILALPAITLAPSLLANIVINDPRYNSTKSSTKSDGGGFSHHRVTTPTQNWKNYGKNDDSKSPIHIFREMLKSRGHNEIHSIDLEGSEYDVVPSPLQLASYGMELVWAVQSSNPPLLRELLGCGLSPNPCNQFRDSVLGDLVCKQGNAPIYRCFVNEFNADLQVVDGFGRTLLHHCCWAKDFCRPIVEDILQRDPIQIFLKDKQEKTPLEYVRPDAYKAWNRFLSEVADKYWPKGSNLPEFSPPFGERRKPNGDLLDPPMALTPALATSVASGNITPKTISNMSEFDRKTYGM